MKVIEKESVAVFLKKHQLLDQYKKAKSFIELGYYELVMLKKRQPTADGIWYFRINKQYRAWAYKSGDTLAVFRIDDHQ